MNELERRAIAIIEQYCGQSFTERQVNERTTLRDMIGRLTQGPVIKIDKVLARSNDWHHASVFGNSGWTEIEPTEIHYHNGKLAVPGHFLNGQYTEADVTYTVGCAVMPDDVRSALELLMRIIEVSGLKRSYSMSALLTPEIMVLLSPYIIRRGGEMNVE